MRSLALALLLLSGCSVAEDNTKTIYGYVEKVGLVAVDRTVNAKLDTGAKSSSLSAIDIKKIKEGNKVWVTFKIPTKKGDIELKREFVGTVKIKKRSENKTLLKKTSAERPIILLTVHLGDQERQIRVNLTDRRRFNYPLLLGRSALIQFNGVVDPSQSFTAKLTKESL